RKDEGFVLALARLLRERSVSLWLDQWDIQASADWDRSIDQALDACAQMLIVLSPNAEASQEVRGELRFALDKSKRITPVLYVPGWIPRQLRIIQFMDFTSGDPHDAAKLDQLARIL